MKVTHQTGDLLAQLLLKHGQLAGFVVEQAAHVFETMLFTFFHHLESWRVKQSVSFRMRSILITLTRF